MINHIQNIFCLHNVCVCVVYIYIYIYIFIRGVTDHKIHGSIRHSGVTVWYVFDRGGNWICRNVGNISVLNHEGEPILIIGL